MDLVTIDDLQTINNYYQKSDSQLGYNSFIGTYSTSLKYKLYKEIIDNDVFCYVIDYNEPSGYLLIPLYLGTNPVHGSNLLKDFCAEQKITNGSYVDENLVPYLKNIFHLKRSDEYAHEVIYPIERFSKFDSIDTQKRRAQIFYRENSQYRLVPYSEDYKNDVICLAQSWESTSSHPTDNCDVGIANFFTENYSKIPIHGYLLFVSDKLVALLFGEMIARETFIINLVKADKCYKGVYQALYHLVFNLTDFKNIKYINGTNLTSVQGLKESKLRLKPCKFAIPWEFDAVL